MENEVVELFEKVSILQHKTEYDFNGLEAIVNSNQRISERLLLLNPEKKFKIQPYLEEIQQKFAMVILKQHHAHKSIEYQIIFNLIKKNLREIFKIITHRKY